MKCNSCGSTKIVKYGTRKCGKTRNQRYQCTSCKKTQVDRDKKFLKLQASDEIIIEAIRLARHGYSLRYIQNKTNVSHQTINNWFKIYKRNKK